MKIPLLGLVLTIAMPTFGVEALSNPADRSALELNGKWAYIVDPYDTGYFDYRLQPYDVQPHPTGGYFLDKSPATSNELTEYEFN